MKDLPSPGTHKYTNALARSKSPYLLQHAHNPVNWYPWDKQALQRAQSENKLIFLSVGYSTCHWCHVMEKESFEREDVAEVLNRHFVSIKVDREERPDVDNVYMNLAHAIGAGGGWPLNLFLTPEGVPFAGGTYFPPEESYGRTGFKTVLTTIAGHWEKNRDKVAAFAEKVRESLRAATPAPSRETDPAELLKRAAREKLNAFDPAHGGFSGAPKFPMPHALSFLLRHAYQSRDKQALEKVTFTLRAMAHGGIYDQLGGGFHRYSTDEKWLAPHFEKMLYDQALLLKVYLEAYQLTGDALFASVARETLDYLERDMLDSQGGFYSAEDADSEGEEGTFYLWSYRDFEEVTRPHTSFLEDWYGVTPQGNFEGKNILTRGRQLEDLCRRHEISLEEGLRRIREGQEKLLDYRSQRVRPHLDDKILTDWNGLLLSALALASRILPQEGKASQNKYLRMAENCARFVLGSLRDKNGRLLKSYREGPSPTLGFIEDYAFFTNGLLDLYEASFKPEYLKEAVRLAADMQKYFWDAHAGGFFYTATDQDSLIHNPKELYDGAIPSGNSVAALVFARLSQMTGDSAFRKIPEAMLGFFSHQLSDHPVAYPQFMQVLDFLVRGGQEIVIASRGDEALHREMVEKTFKYYLPRKVVLHHPAGDTGQSEAGEDGLFALSPFLKNQKPLDGKPTFYLCENHRCQRPVQTSEEVETLLSGLAWETKSAQ